MMRRAVLWGAIAAVLALSGCGQSEAADGYTFVGKQYDRASVQVNKKEYPSFAALRAALPPQMSREWKDKHVIGGAWGVLHADGSCTIHFIDPEVTYQPEWIGHEIGHCFYGQWHP